MPIGILALAKKIAENGDHKVDSDFLVPELLKQLGREALTGRNDMDWGHLDLFHPSEISREFCQRYEQISRLAASTITKKKPAPPSLMAIFAMGHAVHDMVQLRILGKSGLLWGEWISPQTGEIIEGFKPTEIVDGKTVDRAFVYKEPAVLNEKLGYAGHIDGVVILNGRSYILELKSINDNGFNALREPKHEHLLQTQMYMHSEIMLEEQKSVGRAIILYVNKNNSQFKEFRVERNDDDVEELFAQLEVYKKSVADKVLSKRLPECGSENSKRARACRGCETCFRVGAGINGLSQLVKLELTAQEKASAEMEDLEEAKDDTQSDLYGDR